MRRLTVDANECFTGENSKLQCAAGLQFFAAECFIRRVIRRTAMFGRKPKDRHSLYYLLPGMTRANREKRKKIFFWSVLVGLLVAGLMGGRIRE